MAVVAILLGITAGISFINDRYLKLPSTIAMLLVALLISVTIIVMQKMGWTSFGNFLILIIEEFDFSDEEFFGKIADLGQKYAKSTELKKMNGNRGSKHFIYINRTFFGLYNLMHDLKANKVKINNFNKI